MAGKGGKKSKKKTSAGVIKGRVVSETGAPCAEARVMIAAGPSHPDIAALCDEDGRFALGDLAPGEYELRAVADEGGGVLGGVDLAENGAAEITLVVGAEEVLTTEEMMGEEEQPDDA